MKIFKFNTEVIEQVIKELQDAKVFIKIAIFQLHHPAVFKLLNQKLLNGVEVHIFTLPYDSIHEKHRENVTKLFQDIKKNGAKLYFCKWNVGNPERTSTAVGRWYSFHGKFIVTDKSAISLSANFIQNNELDALLIFRNEQNKIKEYNEKFDELINLFIFDNSGYSGNIRQKIIDTGLSAITDVFSLPRVIETTTYSNHWIQHYPTILCPENVPIQDKLYLTPLDCRGRDFIMSLISEAEEYVYLSAESFTDTDFPKFLGKIKLKGIEIFILCGATSMDFSDRIQKMFRELLAYGIKIRTTEDDIHAKLVITDKHVAVTSVNFNKINLGFNKTKHYWRENTESITICSDDSIISQAKNGYIEVFNRSNDIKLKLAEKLETFIGKMFTDTFGLHSQKVVKQIFAQIIIIKEVEVKKFVLKIGKITAYLMKYFKRNLVNKKDFFMALILYYLSNSKLNYNQLYEKLDKGNEDIELGNLLNSLFENNFISREDDYYKINIEQLF
jgi:phosphatidylserine/phosphatidylglycerophosphate/cardiolipin synthase-like enzyme